MVVLDEPLESDDDVLLESEEDDEPGGDIDWGDGGPFDG